MNQRRLSPTDLQSVAFDHSAILPLKQGRTRRYSRKIILPYILRLSILLLSEYERVLTREIGRRLFLRTNLQQL